MSPELEAAYVRLNQAIEDIRQAKAKESPGEIASSFLGDWALIIAQHDANRPGVTRYDTFYAGGELPYHNCIGLWETAVSLLEMVNEE